MSRDFTGQVATIHGDAAQGENYSTADHLLADSDMILVWSIRYQDQWRREDSNWRFTKRTLIIDWEEIRPATIKESNP